MENHQLILVVTPPLKHTENHRITIRRVHDYTNTDSPIQRFNKSTIQQFTLRTLSPNRGRFIRIGFLPQRAMTLLQIVAADLKFTNLSDKRRTTQNYIFLI